MFEQQLGQTERPRRRRIVDGDRNAGQQFRGLGQLLFCPALQLFNVRQLKRQFGGEFVEAGDYLVVIVAERQMEELLPQPRFKRFARDHGGRMVDDVCAAGRHLLVLLPGGAEADILHVKTAVLQHLDEISGINGRIVVADNVDASVVKPARFQEAVKLFARLGVWRSSGLSHNGVHIAIGKRHVRKFLAQSGVDVIEVAADEMVDAACKDQHGLGHLGQFM